MAGFKTSPQFDEGVAVLVQMAQIEGLRDGYAILGADLSTARWAEDEARAEESLGRCEIKARVPHFADSESPREARVNLFAGLIDRLESDRSMVSALAPDGHDMSAWERSISNVEQHLFGAVACEEAA